MSNKYIKKRGEWYVIISNKTGKVLSKHATRKKAEASFRAMEARKYGRPRGR